MSEPVAKVVIVGAGLVGSLAAIYMARLGHKVVVYEKRPDMRIEKKENGRSINLALSVRGITALKEVGLDKLVMEMAIPMGGRMIHSSNEPTVIPYGDFGESIYSVSRRGLNEILLDAATQLGNVQFIFDEELESMDADKGKLIFLNVKSGKVTEETADFILGCDGAYSIVRNELMKFSRINFSQEYVPHGYKEFSIPADKVGEWKMPPNYLHIWPRHQFMLIALPNLDGMFTVTLFYPHNLFEKITTSKQVKDLFQKEFLEALNLIGEDRVIQEFFNNRTGSLVTMRCSKYHYEDKVIILGDAAHAMVPFYGQGMNAGFEDLSVLSKILTEIPDRSKAFAEFSHHRHPDAMAICNLALYNYWEMSSAVTSRLFRLKRAFYGKLHKIIPRFIVPLYSMVAFSNIPYGEVVRRHARQERIVNAVLGTTIGAIVMGLLGYFTVIRRLQN